MAMVGFAQDGFPISTDRGTAFASSSSVVTTGRWQIEAGYTWNRVAGTTSQTFGELGLRYPILPKLELRFGNLVYARVPGANGLVDPTIGFKYRMADAAPGRPEVSVIVQTTIAAGGNDFRVNRSQPSIQVPWFHQLDATTGIGGMFSVSDLGPSAARFTQYGGGVYVSHVLNPKTTGYFEVFELAPLGKDGPNGAFADFALTYLVDKATQLDFRVGSGLNQKRDGWFVGAGIAFRF